MNLQALSTRLLRSHRTPDTTDNATTGLMRDSDVSAHDAKAADLEDPEHFRKGHRPQKSTHRVLLGLLRAILLCLAVWGTIDLCRRLHRHLTHDAVLCHCGPTTATALARGCEFDEHELAWLNPRCIDRELSAEFSRASSSGAWEYETALADGRLARVNATQLSEMVEPGRQVWFTYEQHVTHCYFSWLKEFRREWTGTVMHLPREKEAHVRHCGKMFLLRSGLDEWRTKLVYPARPVG